MRTIIRSMSLGLLLILAGVAIAVMPTSASAQDPTFMLVPGIPGSSLDAHHLGWIDVVSLRQSWSAAAKKNACEIEIVKGLDIAGPRLWAAAVTGQLFTEIRIEVTRTDQTKTYEIRLSNAQITSIVTAGTTTFAETVTITAAGMNLFFYPQNPDGSIGAPVTTSIACS